MRGENKRKRPPKNTPMGSSPHARGKLPSSSVKNGAERLIPACAGKTPRVKCLFINRTAHPRMRGENSQLSSAPGSARGSSPHARGKQSSARLLVPFEGLIPACAGKTGRRRKAVQNWEAHPRMRGENRKALSFRIRRIGSSPHARGKLRKSRHAHAQIGAHPRMRGENARGLQIARCMPGSSPHARGKQQ